MRLKHEQVSVLHTSLMHRLKLNLDSAKKKIVVCNIIDALTRAGAHPIFFKDKTLKYVLNSLFISFSFVFVMIPFPFYY